MMRKCFFCGETNEIVLEEHHIIPKSLNLPMDFELITLCSNCHRKLHYILNPLTKYIDIKFEEIDTKKTHEQLEKVRLRKNAKTKILTYIKEHKGQHRYNFVPKEKVIDDLGTVINGFETRKLIEELLMDGIIYEPRKGHFKITDEDLWF